MKLLRQNRKTEPKSILRCRILVMIIILLLLLAYALVLIFNVINDTPVITTRSEVVDSIPFPWFDITIGYNFTMNCFLYGKYTILLPYYVFIV